MTDPSTPVTYYAEIDNDSNFGSPNYIRDWSTRTSWTPTLSEGLWYWHVRARDNASNVGSWSVPRSFRINVTYIISVGPITGTAIAGENYVSFLNPSGSGKLAIVKRIEIRVDDATSAGKVYVPMTLRPITGATGGTLIPGDNIPKKYWDAPSSGMEIRDRRTAAIALTSSPAADKRILGVTTPGALGQLNGQKEIVFASGDELVLQPGQGFALYQEAAGSTYLRVRLLVEWSEVTL